MIAEKDVFDLSTAPMRIGMVRLKVRDLARVSAFYQRILGLTPLEEREGTVVLGAAAAPLLELSGDAGLAPRDPRAAGLFHTAFLMPGRADLARWLAFVIEERQPLQGASDHIVSEAIYLADPEGNGIEVYADHPPSRWRGADGEIRMTTDPLDRQDLLAAAGGTVWAGFPEGGVIGHIHLQVGDMEKAERFYRDILGFDVTSRYPGASFFGSGGYHHQLAGNVWNSRHASKRPDHMAGLEEIELVLKENARRESILARAQSAGIRVRGDAVLYDPWGTAITLVTGPRGPGTRTAGAELREPRSHTHK